MKCLHPITVNPYKHIKKYIEVPCGKCSECLKNKRDAIAFRLDAEYNDPTTFYCCFVTLTYDDEHLPIVSNETTGEQFSVVSPDDIKRFHKYLRKLVYPVKFRFAVFSEYGDKFGRPHYHGVYFLHDMLEFEKFKAFIKTAWVNGNADVQLPRNGFRAFNYVTKYVLKGIGSDIKSEFVKPFMRLSKYLGLASVKKYSFTPSDKLLVQNSEGRKVILPRYYHTHIFNDIQLKVHQAFTSLYMDNYLDQRLSFLNLNLPELRDLQYSSKSARSISNLYKFCSLRDEYYKPNLKYI